MFIKSFIVLILLFLLLFIICAVKIAKEADERVIN